jgi:hypothetical protein
VPHVTMSRGPDVALRYEEMARGPHRAIQERVSAAVPHHMCLRRREALPSVRDARPGTGAIARGASMQMVVWMLGSSVLSH